jgi:hypothetical protein
MGKPLVIFFIPFYLLSTAQNGTTLRIAFVRAAKMRKFNYGKKLSTKNLSFGFWLGDNNYCDSQNAINTGLAIM